MRNRAGMNTSVVFGFVKFLRDIQKRERPDLLGVAFDPRGAVSAATSSPVQGEPFRDARRHPAFGALRQAGARSDVHPDPRSRGVRGRRRDRNPFAEGRRGGLRCLYGDPRQGLRTARARPLPHLQAAGRGGEHRDRRPRGHPREVRHRRPSVGARHPRAVGRRFGQHPRRAGHRRKERLQAGAGVGNGREHPRQRFENQGKTGREDRRVGRQPASGQAPDDHLPRRADPLPRGGPHGLANRISTSCAGSSPSSISRLS